MGSGASLAISGTGTVSLDVSSGSSISGLNHGVSVASGATLQLAGTISVLSDATTPSNVANVANNGQVTVTGTNQVVGSITGSSSNGSGATIYAGNTTVGDGTNAARLTATQILQNSLTINANSTVTILPSGSGGTMAASPSGSAAIASSSTDVATSNAASAGTSDPFTAIQAAIASGAISGTTGQVLENRIAAIERLAATDPGLDVSLLESRVLAVLPSTPVLGDTSPIADSGANLLVLDSSASGSGPSGSPAAFSATPSFTGGAAAVPEPSSLLLAALAGIGLLAVGRRDRKARRERRG